MGMTTARHPFPHLQREVPDDLFELLAKITDSLDPGDTRTHGGPKGRPKIFIETRVVPAGDITYDVTYNTGWWFEPLWQILVSWDDYSRYMNK